MQRPFALLRALSPRAPVTRCIPPSLRIQEVAVAGWRPRQVVPRVVSGRAAAAGAPDDGSDANDANAAAPPADEKTAPLPTTPPPPPPFARRAYDSLTRASWYRWYLDKLERRPTLTKALTACCGFVVGDLIAQTLSSGGGGGIALVDWARTARMGAFGLLFDGPVGGAFYAWLDRNIYPEDPLSTRAVLTKTAIDQTIYSAVGTVCFFTFIRLLETGGDWSAIGPTIALKFLPTLAANYAIWPIAHLFNFRFVPPPLRVLYNQVIAIGWLTLLSILAHAPPGAGPAAAAVVAIAHKAGGGGAGAAAAGGAGGWLQGLLSALPHF